MTHRSICLPDFPGSVARPPDTPAGTDGGGRRIGRAKRATIEPGLRGSFGFRARPSLRRSGPRVANITNATTIPCPLLFMLLFCTPPRLAYGWFGGASKRLRLRVKVKFWNTNVKSIKRLAAELFLNELDAGKNLFPSVLAFPVGLPAWL
jgi:hypothetical protein